MSSSPWSLPGRLDLRDGQPRRAPRTQDIDPTFASLSRFFEAVREDEVYLDAQIARDEFERRGQLDVIDSAGFLPSCSA
jgi:hypothetical protein